MTRRPSGLAPGLFGGALLLSGCATVPVSADRTAFAAAPSRNAVPRTRVELDRGATLLLDLRLDRQQASNSCGAHAAAAVIDYWMRARPPAIGRPAPSGVEIFAADPPVASEGYSLAEMVDLLQDAGLVAVAVGTTPAGIGQELRAGRPVIARVSVSAGYLATFTLFPSGTPVLGHVEARAGDLAARLLEPMSSARIEHYWVVIGLDSDTVIVLDPALGIRAVQSAAFARAFDRGGNLAVVVGGWA
jgi:predicted double-glycine peptidase